MADGLKVLGQTLAMINTWTDHYTVPANAKASVSSIVMCNVGDEDALIKITCAVAGEALSDKQYIAHELRVDAHETQPFTIGITLAATDVIRVYSDTGTVAFTTFGAEIT